MNHKRISKKMGIAIFCLLAGIMALIIIRTIIPLPIRRKSW